MKIAYDGHVFRWRTFGGISRYFSEIISGLPSHWRPTILGGEIHALPERLSHPGLHISIRPDTPPRRITRQIKKHWWHRRYLSSGNVLHPTYYNLTHPLAFSQVKCPVVVTFHDFIAARHPNLEPLSDDTIRLQREAIKRADRIVCVSKNTEQDLIYFHPEAEGRTCVIYHGASFPVELRPASPTETPFFLYVGGRATYKNFGFILRAFAKASAVNNSIQLHVAGPELTPDEKWQIHFLGISGRVKSVVHPDESGLQDLYRSSLALLYPSRHEGFGIPPLEAMACGTVPVTSNATSLPEVLGNAGILLDPTNEDDWVNCMLSLAAGSLPRTEILERGRKRATELSWSASVEKHVNLYRQLS